MISSRCRQLVALWWELEFYPMADLLSPPIHFSPSFDSDHSGRVGWNANTIITNLDKINSDLQISLHVIVHIYSQFKQKPNTVI